MNIFSVLGVNYEVFHTRMLGWLLSPAGEHSFGTAALGGVFDLAEVSGATDLSISQEVKIDVPSTTRYRLADLVIRTERTFLLIENKVDPGYQDIEQLRDEVTGGRSLAVAEGRAFVFVLIAPGPLVPEVAQELDALGGKFISWTAVIDRLRALPTDDCDPATAAIVRQYIDFVERQCTPRRSSGAIRIPSQRDKTLAEAESALRELVLELPDGVDTNATRLWQSFVERWPDHVQALSERWADARYYSAKSWFAFKLRRLAAQGEVLEDTGRWEAAPPGWGFPQVRVYRRVAGDLLSH